MTTCDSSGKMVRHQDPSRNRCLKELEPKEPMKEPIHHEDSHWEGMKNLEPIERFGLFALYIGG